MPSMQAQINDLHTYANNINARVGNLDVAFTARVLILEAKVEALGAKQRLQGAQVIWLRQQLKNKDAKIENLEAQQNVHAAQLKDLKSNVELIAAHLESDPETPIVADTAVELPKYRGRCQKELYARKAVLSSVVLGCTKARSMPSPLK